MLWLYNRIAKRFSVSCMHCNSGSTLENLNRVFGQAQIYLFSNQVKGNGVFVHAVRNQIIMSKSDQEPRPPAHMSQSEEVS